MTVFILKLIAFASMLTDHTAVALHSSGILPDAGLYEVMRSIGRIAFPLFCFMLANGSRKTRDGKKYFERLSLFAVLSQIPFCLVAAEQNYSAAAGAPTVEFRPLSLLLLLPLAVWFIYSCGRRWDRSCTFLLLAFAFAGVKITAGGYLLSSWQQLNVFYTLACGLESIRAVRETASAAAEGNYLKAAAVCAALVCAVLVMQVNADYGIEGLLLIVLFASAGENRKKAALYCCLWCLLMYLSGGITEEGVGGFYVCLTAFSLLSCAGILLYNGKLGPKPGTAFYLIYPIHLAVLALIFVLKI